MNDLLTVREAADALRLKSTASIYYAIDKGHLTYVTSDVGVKFIRQHDLDVFALMRLNNLSEPMPGLVTLAEAARRLKTSKSNVLRLVKQGRIRRQLYGHSIHKFLYVATDLQAIT